MGNLLLTTVGLLLLSGCAHFTTYNKTVRPGDNADSTITFMDAKQRALITSIKQGNKSGEFALRRFCAEPSPDALSALAASNGLSLDVKDQGNLGTSQALSEGAASIGLRTQSIQILRDVMYRNCEAFLNDGITEFGLETLQRRFQSTLVAVLAIEQLTGAVKAQAVALGGSAVTNNAEVLKSAIELVGQTEKAEKTAQSDLDDATAAKVKAQSAFDDFTAKHKDDTTSAEYLDVKGKLDKAKTAETTSKKTHTDRLADLDQAKSVRAAATSAGGAGSVSVHIDPAGANPTAPTDKVAEAVAGIVKDTLELGFGREVCTTLFGLLVSANKSDQLKLHDLSANFGAKCVAYLDSDIVSFTDANKRAQQEQANRDALVAQIAQLMDKVASGAIAPEKAAPLLDGLSKLVANAPVASKPPPVFVPFKKTVSQ